MDINIIVIVCLLCVFVILNGKNENNKKNTKNKNYIFAYGSLLNYYIQKILLKKTILWPKATLKKEAGYERFWLTNDAYGVTLGILPSKTPKNINGIIMEISDEELKKFDKYEIEESKHIKKKLKWENIDCDEKYKNKNNNLYVYIIDSPPKKIDIVKKVPNLYAQTVMSGFARYGDDYLDLFLKLTK